MNFHLPEGTVVKNLAELLTSRAKLQKNILLYQFIEPGEDIQSISYEELDSRAKAIATMLLGAGAKKGDRAILVYNPGIELIAAFFGCLYAGVIAIPVYPPVNAKLVEKLQAIIEDACPEFFLSTQAIVQKLTQLKKVKMALKVPIIKHITKHYWEKQTSLTMWDFENIVWHTTDNVSLSLAYDWQPLLIEPDQIAFLQYTSGSTNVPKGVMVSHKNLLHNLGLIYQGFNFGNRENIKLVSWLPPYHDMGLIGGILEPIYASFPCVLMSPMTFLQSPIRWLSTISEEQATISGGPNFAFDYCVKKITEEQKSRLDLSQWELAFCGAEPIQHATFMRFYEAFKHCGFKKEAFYPCYGLAEATLFVSGLRKKTTSYTSLMASDSMLRQGQIKTVTSDNPDAKIIVSCGELFQDYKLVNPETLQACQPDEVGELWLASDSVAQGYWQNPNETAKAFHAKISDDKSGKTYLRTGDLAFIFENNLYIAGRLKDIIIVHGANYYPQDIEYTISHCDPHLHIGNCLVFSIEENNEEHLVVVAEVERVLSDDYYEVIFHNIIKAVAEHHNLTVYQIILIPPKQLPKTTSGKVRRQPCKALWQENKLAILKIWQAFQSHEHNAKNTALINNSDIHSRNKISTINELQVKEIVDWVIEWLAKYLNEKKEVLRKETAFASYGIDSIAQMQLIQELGTHLNKVLDPMLILEYPTAQLFAEAIVRGEGVKESSTLIPLHSIIRSNNQNLALSLGQERLWFLQRLHPDSIYYNLGAAYRFKGKLNASYIKLACQALIHRHDSLRTIFKEENEKAKLVILPEIELPWRVLDCDNLAPEEQAWQIKSLIEELIYTPYDLAQGPLIRFAWINLSADEALFVFAAHHIIFDGWSSKVLLEDIKAYYEALSENCTVSLTSLPLQYQDFAYWQREYLQDENAKALEQFWLTELADINPILTLPTDKPRPPQSLANITRYSFALDPALSEQVECFSKTQRITVFTVLLSVYQVLLAKYSQQQDFCIGVPMFGREEKQLEPLIGFFTNVLPIPAKLDNSLTVTQLMKQVNVQVRQAQRHQAVPFELLIDKLNIERSLNHSPLFQVMFLFQNVEKLEIKIKDALGKLYYTESGHLPYDLTLEMYKENNVYHGHIIYAEELFEKDTINRVSQHYINLLQDFINAPDKKLNELNLLSEEEIHRIISWNNTKRDYPKDKMVHQLFEQQAEQQPDHIALILGEQQLTYRELNEKANQLAHYLIKQGLNTEQIVAVYLEYSLELVIALLAVLKAGGTFLALDPASPSDRLSYMLSDAQPALIITSSPASYQLNDYPINKLVFYDKIASAPCQNKINPIVYVHKANLAYIIYTSGSTGIPKAVMVSHASWANAFYTWQRLYGLGPALNCHLQIDHFIFDVFMGDISRALASGAKLILVPKNKLYDPAQLYQLITQHQVKMVDTVPALLKLLAEYVISHGLTLPSIKVLACGGEHWHAKDANNIKRCLNPNVLFTNGYGVTEATIDNAYYAIGSRIELQKLPFGKPVDNTKLYIVDDNLNLMPIGVTGELCIAGAGLARGYLNRSNLTAERFVANPFATEEDLKAGYTRLYKTGDLCRWLSDGNIEYIGRIGQQINIHGFRIELGEIETYLEQHPAIQEAVVILHEDVPDHKRIIGYYRVKSHEAAPAYSELRNYLATRLPDYMMPHVLMALDEFPLTPNGKLNKKALPAPECSLLESYIAPSSTLEYQLAAIWQEVLQQEQIGIHDNFFELGGHSLLAAQVVTRIREELHVELPLPQFFQTPTIEGIAVFIKQTANKNEENSIEIMARPAKIPLSFAQQRLWFIQQLEPDSAQYNIPIVLRLEGKLNSEALEKSLNQLIDRHEILRTYFQTDEEGNAIQVIVKNLDFKIEYAEIQQQETKRIREYLSDKIQQKFKLNQLPLLRVYLLRLEENLHLLLINIHHSVCDGWSFGIIARELGALYEAAISGNTTSLEPLPLQYADFSLWQRHYLSPDSQTYQRQINYWQTRLANSPRLLDLPTDYPRPAKQNFAGDSLAFELSAELTQQLKILCINTKTTLFMLLLAAFYVLLYRHSGQEDIIIGSPIANRNRKQVENLIGFFVNTLALRAEIKSNESFSEFLQCVKQYALEAYEHQDLPFEHLVELLKIERSLSHNPVFQVMFVLQNNQLPELNLPDLNIKFEDCSYQLTNFDLTLEMEENATGLQGRFEYCTALFTRASIARLMNHFKILLQSIVSAPQKKLSELALLSAEEQHQLLVEWNCTQQEYLHDKTIIDLFEEQVKGGADDIAVIHHEQQLTYSELNAKANQLAHYLIDQGVKPNQIIAICLERSIEFIISILAVLKTGGAYLPVDLTYPTQRLAFMLQDTNAPFLITMENFLEKLPELTINVICLDKLQQTINQYNTDNPYNPVCCSQNYAYVLYTSGSTGTPKGVVIPHKGVVHLVLNQDCIPFKKTDVISHASNISFDAAILEIWGALLHGAKLVIIDTEELLLADVFGQKIAKYQITVIMLITRLFNQLYDQSPEIFNSVKYLIIGGEAADVQRMQNFLRKNTSITLINAYGPTENTNTSTCYTLVQNLDHHHIPLGRPIANTSVYILDKSLQPLPIGAIGELHVGGEGLAHNYLNRPDLTAERFIANPFATEADVKAGHTRLYKTGDLCRWLPDGNIEFIGRTDHQVKLRGFRIETGEIEAQLEQHPAIHEAIVVVREDDTSNKDLVAYYRLAHTEMTPSEYELRNYLATALPAYMLPSSFIALEKFPLNANGKLDLKALPDPVLSINVESYQAPRDALELKLVQIWLKVLGRTSIGIQDNFFEIGGHSLLVVQLIHDINLEFQLNLPLATIFNYPTIALLAEHLNPVELKQPFNRPLVAINSAGSKSPIFAMHPIGGNVLCYFALSKQLGPEQPFYALQQITDKNNSSVSSIKQMAARYIIEIRSVQPKGPYQLLGWSLGGVIAHEIAYQLESQGEEVAFVALLDSYLPEAWSAAEPKEMIINDIDMLLAFAQDLGGNYGKTVHLKEAILEQLTPEERLPYLIKELQDKNIINTQLDIEELTLLFEQARKNLIALNQHKASMVNAQLLLVVAKKKLEYMATGFSHKLMQQKQISNWQEYTKNKISILALSANHYEIMQKPIIQQIAKWLEEQSNKINSVAKESLLRRII